MNENLLNVVNSLINDDETMASEYLKQAMVDKVRQRLGINESKKTNLTLEDAVKIFHDDCVSFQKEIGFNGKFDFDPLYMGMNGNSDISVNNFKSNKNATSHIPSGINKYLDDWFYKKFGVKFRSNALFTTADSDMASNQGTTYVVFPIGDFKYCYSNYVEDMYCDILDEIYITDFTKLKSKERAEYFSELDEKLEDANYLDNNLKQSSKRIYPEMMINCKSYLAIKESEYEKFVELYLETYK